MLVLGPTKYLLIEGTLTNPHVFYMWKKRYSYAVSMASRKAKNTRANMVACRASKKGNSKGQRKRAGIQYTVLVALPPGLPQYFVFFNFVFCLIWTSLGTFVM